VDDEEEEEDAVGGVLALDDVAILTEIVKKNIRYDWKSP
jgi:hypothetical protein